MEKDEIRAAVRLLRRELISGGSDRLRRESELICRKIEALDSFRKAGTVLSYSPMKGEVDVSLLDCNGKKVILADCDWQEIPADEIEFAIIPGVAFAPDVDGRGFMRLGRGGGYYDRLLPQLHCKTVAPAFVFQLFETIPFDSWDRPVDEVVISGDIVG